MKKLSLFIIVAFAMLCFFISCERESSADVNQDRIYVLYELVYDKTDDITYARSTFFFGSVTGTRLQLADPSAVSFNETQLGFQEALAYYETQMTGYVNTGEFSWTDLDGNTFVNTPIVHEIDFPATLDTIVKGQAYELTWVGDSLTTNEQVYAFINGTAENDEINVYQTTQYATKLFITAAQTQKLTVGTNTIFMRRRIDINPQEATSAGAMCSGIYETLTVEIEVK
ncbi:MAG TPA: hypothetical protein PKN32_00360 [Bacteroidales bacterium]|nr:hypothetical protein [Bacteroidales bacterium]